MRRSFWGLAVGAAVVVAGLAAWQLGSPGGLLTDVSASASPSGPSARPGARSAPSTPTTAHHRATTTTTKPPPPPLGVTAVTPASGATNVSGTAPLTVSFSAPLTASSPRPTLSPAVAGTWTQTSPTTLSFSPTGAYLPGAQETLTVPGGAHGALSSDGARLAKAVVTHLGVADGSVLRLQQLLSLLDYSPLSFTPAPGHAVSPTDAAAQAKAAYSPPPGTFAWRHSGWPASLVAQWHQGSYDVMTKGLVMSFEADHGLTVDGQVSPQLWGSVLDTLAHHQLNTGGYNYAVGSKTAPESLTIWHDGSQVFHSLANTGIAQAQTSDGTFPVYERLRNQVMKGTNPDGSHYSDPVQYVAYFNGGDAVHYIPRANYGTPASLGCIELPLQAAAQAWPWLAYGTLVTVTG